MIEEYSMKRAQSGHLGKILQKVGWKTSRISTFASRGWNLYQMSQHHTNGSILTTLLLLDAKLHMYSSLLTFTLG